MLQFISTESTARYCASRWPWVKTFLALLDSLRIEGSLQEARLKYRAFNIWMDLKAGLMYQEIVSWHYVFIFDQESNTVLPQRIVLGQEFFLLR